MGISLKEAFDMNRRGFLKGVAATVGSGGTASKAVAAASKSSLSHRDMMKAHHQVLSSHGWKAWDGPGSLHSNSLYYEHPKMPGHTVTVMHRPGIEKGNDVLVWHEPPDTHHVDRAGYGFDTPEERNHLFGRPDTRSPQNLHKNLSQLPTRVKAAHERDTAKEDRWREDQDKKTAKSKPKSKTSNWGRTSTIAKGRPSQTKPKVKTSISIKEAFFIAEAIKLMHKGESNGFHFYHFQADNKVKGHIWAEPDGKKLHIHNIATNHNKKQGKPNTLGHKNMRDIFRGLKQHHPEAEHVTGIRVSGARPDASQSRVVANLKKV